MRATCEKTRVAKDFSRKSTREASPRTHLTITGHDMSIPGSEQDQVRVLMWCTPRSTSTVFAKCLSFVPESQIFFEPYGYCYSFLDKLRAVSTHKEDARHPNPSKKVIFVKDMAYGIVDSTQFLPDSLSNYRFAFLIRHPIRVFSSWKRAVLNIHAVLEQGRAKNSEASKEGVTKASEAFHVGNDTVSWYNAPGLFYKELYDLWTIVMQRYDPNPVVVDSDDLVSDPSTVLPKFCQKLGIPYSDSLLKWDGSSNIIGNWIFGCTKPNDCNKVNCDAAFNSTCFKGSSPMPSFQSLAPDIKECVQRTMPYYLKMYSWKI
ncbi:uncharacterized protein [Diadema antillarum]|uniref:uncharacterized protein n=1 Tax=Diadema antillarum TaxID=105358 RepID=UPI003A855808